MIRGNFSVINPDDIQCEMTVTMSLKEWKQIAASLGDAYPDWQLKGIITDLVMMAEKQFYSSHKSK